MKLKISPLNLTTIPTIVALAEEIWHEHYTPIIGAEQVFYMLDKFQSEQAVTAQINDGYEYFEVNFEEELMGYFSLQLRKNDSLFISKFYLAKSARGKRLGSAMFKHIETLAIEQKCKTIDLTVNKYNPAYEVYLKLGFSNVGSIEVDIGKGYIMDDYLMQKLVAPV
ncbi:MAG: GNAT family N-acetyltransferase [Kangiellaceae bacterium]|nr:GNAT family N-acetyltransferase [Kangiellaceae bacterium]